jgi:1-acyl-sn-glycerol-3-phosphate acyltransferase
VGPNFGYELCLRRITDEELDGIDLSTWRVAFNGAEPVSPVTVTRFPERFADVGFDPGAMAPVYGLAESSVALAVPPMGRGVRLDHVDRDALARTGQAAPVDADDDRAVPQVGCGHVVPGHEIRIVDRDSRVLPERQQGRIQFRGPSATSGYIRNPAATRKLFDGDWLDSGDLGYLADGELFVTGRVKDLIIRAGRNLHPAELEHAVGEIADVRRGCVAVFAATDVDSGTERLVVLAETRATDQQTHDAIRQAITAASVELTGTPPDDVVLASPGTVPKTSSGKIRRAEARERYEQGDLTDRSRAVWWQVARLALSTAGPRMAAVIRRAVARLYGVWALAVFVVAALVVWPMVMVLPGLDRRWRMVRGAVRLVVALVGSRLEVDGSDHIPRDGPFVLVANHASHVDPLVPALLLERPPMFTVIAGVADRWIVRQFLRRMEVRLVQRGDRVDGSQATRDLVEVLRSGRPVVFFPEGRRTPRPGLEQFRMGAFAVAAEAGVPVVPVAIRGTRDVLPVGSIWPRRATLHATVTPSLIADGSGWGAAVDLRDRARAAILDACNEPDLLA